jgi:hypothetical protein
MSIEGRGDFRGPTAGVIDRLSLLEGIDLECCDNPHGLNHAAGSNQTTTDIPSRMSHLGGAGRSNRRFLIDAAEQRTKS